MAGIIDPKAAGSSSAVPQPKTGAAEAKTKVMISIESFPLGLRVPFDVFSKDREGNYSCVLKKWTRFEQDAKSVLRSKGVVFLYVEGEPGQVKEYFTDNHAAGNAGDEKTKYDSYLKSKDTYHHVSRLVFTPGSKVNFSLYKSANMQFLPIVETDINRFVPITDSVRNADGNLAIKVADMKLFREYLAALSKSPATDRTVVQARVAGIKENSKVSVRDFLSEPDSKQNTEEVITSANQIINVLKRKEAAISDLLSLNVRDLHLYNHSANVAVLSAALGLASGMSQDQIEKLSIGAMMHDVGKKNIPLTILHKKDRLTAEEFASWQKHVTEGVSLIRNNNVPREAFAAIEQHHERLSGRGYPNRLSGRLITPFGRILSIVDCYDSLTTRRPFRQPLTPFMALEMIMKEAAEKGDFDIELVKLLVKILRGQGRI